MVATAAGVKRAYRLSKIKRKYKKARIAGFFNTSMQMLFHQGFRQVRAHAF